MIKHILEYKYGHVLHLRMFDVLGLESKADQYLWFFEQGYAKMRKSGFSEIDTIQVAKGLDLQLMKNPTWTPGKQSMSVKDHIDVIQRLKEKEIAFQEVAATIDKV